MKNIDKHRWLDLCDRAYEANDAYSFEAIRVEIEGFLNRRKRQLGMVPNCALCGKPVPLENAKTDEGGLAVHEQCQSAKLREPRKS